MSAAKDEIAEYLPPTRFGKNKPRIRRDTPMPRPENRNEVLRQIKWTFDYNRWDELDVARNAAMLNLEAIPLAGYTDDELKIILDDLERYGMIIYEK